MPKKHRQLQRKFSLIQVKDENGALINCLQEVTTSAKARESVFVPGVDEHGVIRLGPASTMQPPVQKESASSEDDSAEHTASDDSLAMEAALLGEIASGEQFIEGIEVDEEPDRYAGNLSDGQPSVHDSPSAGPDIVAQDPDDAEWQAIDSQLSAIQSTDLASLVPGEMLAASALEYQTTDDLLNPGFNPDRIAFSVPKDSLQKESDAVPAMTPEEQQACLGLLRETYAFNTSLSHQIGVDARRPLEVRDRTLKGDMAPPTTRIVAASSSVKKGLLEFLYGDEADLNDEDMEGLSFEDECLECAEEDSKHSSSSAVDRATDRTVVAREALPAEMLDTYHYFNNDYSSDSCYSEGLSRRQVTNDDIDALRNMCTGQGHTTGGSAGGRYVKTRKGFSVIPGASNFNEELSQRQPMPLAAIQQDVARLAAQDPSDSETNDDDGVPRPADVHSEKQKARTILDDMMQEAKQTVAARSSAGRPAEIVISKRTGVPLSVFSTAKREESAPKDEDAKEIQGVELPVLPSERPTDETAEERRSRKALLKDIKRERRDAKRDLKEQFRTEALRQVRVKLLARSNVQGHKID